MKQYKTILLDADGTIFDFDKAETYALQNALSTHGYECTSEVLCEYKRINASLWALLEQGKTTQSQIKPRRFEMLFESLGFSEDSSGAAASFIEYLSQGAFFLDGAVDILEYLSAKYPLYLVTNGITKVQQSRYELAGLGRYFKEAFISESMGVSKPYVEYFNQVFDAIGLKDKNSAIIIGDSLTSDIRGGNNAGIDTCWYNQFGKQNDTGITPTYEISALSDLKQIL